MISQASVYGVEELGFPQGTMLGVYLLVQFVAVGGALLFGRIAATRGAKNTILGGLAANRVMPGAEMKGEYLAERVADFFGERPRAPQLPAYVVARKQAGKAVAAGIAVASLKTGGEKLQGIMRVDGDANQDPGIAGLVNVAKTREVGDWEEAVEHWERIVNGPLYYPHQALRDVP